MRIPTKELDALNDESERCLQSGDFERAFELADQVIRKSPTVEFAAWAMCLKANMLIDVARFEEATELYRNALRTIESLQESPETRQVGAFANAGLALSIEDDTDGNNAASIATPLLETVIKDTRDPAERGFMSSMLASMYQRIGRAGEALLHYEESVATATSESDKVSALLGLGGALRETGELERALSVLEQARKSVGHLPLIAPSIFLEIALVHEAAERDEEAALALHSVLDAIERSPIASIYDGVRALAHWHLATIYYNSENLPRANKHARETLEYVAADTYGYAASQMMLGHVALADSRFADARAHYALALSSGQLSEEDVKNVKEGLRLIEKHEPK